MALVFIFFFIWVPYGLYTQTMAKAKGHNEVACTTSSRAGSVSRKGRTPNIGPAEDLQEMVALHSRTAVVLHHHSGHGRQDHGAVAAPWSCWRPRVVVRVSSCLILQNNAGITLEGDAAEQLEGCIPAGGGGGQAQRRSGPLLRP